MIFIPANSEGEYNLSSSALVMGNPTLIIDPVYNNKIVHEPALDLPPVLVALNPEEPPPAQSLEPSKASSTKAPAKQPDAEVPADWQKGLEAPK